MSKSSAMSRKPIVLAPGQGRAYPMGRISAMFKADEDETASRYSVSEWWLDFENPGGVRAGILNFSSPGPFEPDMPGIVEWFAQNPPKDTGT